MRPCRSLSDLAGYLQHELGPACDRLEAERQALRALPVPAAWLNEPAGTSPAVPSAGRQLTLDDLVAGDPAAHGRTEKP